MKTIIKQYVIVFFLFIAFNIWLPVFVYYWNKKARHKEMSRFKR